MENQIKDRKEEEEGSKKASTKFDTSHDQRRHLSCYKKTTWYVSVTFFTFNVSFIFLVQFKCVHFDRKKFVIYSMYYRVFLENLFGKKRKSFII